MHNEHRSGQKSAPNQTLSEVDIPEGRKAPEGDIS